MIDEGVIKFNHVFIQETGPIEHNVYAELEATRQVLFQKGLIGAYPDGIGFGNLSQIKDLSQIYETNKNQFIISGTQTGEHAELNGAYYTQVVDYDFNQNLIKVIGPIKASSESLTHAGIYECSKEINCVIHIHNKKIWNALLENDYPTIPKDVAYGTQEMAAYAQKLVKSKSPVKLMVMQGHDEGVIFYGENLQECLDLTLDIYQKFI